MATAEQTQNELRVILHGVPWTTYVALRDVPELWRYDGRTLEVFELNPAVPHVDSGARHEVGALCSPLAGWH